MDRDFEIINQFVRGDLKTKEFLFTEIVGLFNTLLAQLKGVLVTGTKEEKKELLIKLKLLRQVMQAYFVKVQDKVNLSSEEIGLIMGHYLSNSSEYREKLVAMRQEMQEHKQDLSKLVKADVRPKSLKSVKTKSKWIRS